MSTIVKFVQLRRSVTMTTHLCRADSLYRFTLRKRNPELVETSTRIVTARSHYDSNITFYKYFSMPLLLQYQHFHLLVWDPFFRCHCRHNWVQNPFNDDIQMIKILSLPPQCERALRTPLKFMSTILPQLSKPISNNPSM